VLLSIIDDDIGEKAELINNLLDVLKMYINPQIFKEELVQRGEYIDEYAKVNSEFEQQSKIGHATGYMQSSERVTAYLEKFYSTDSVDDAGTVYLSGEKGVDITAQVKSQKAVQIPAEDSEELG